jgi:hypothetical protein
MPKQIEKQEVGTRKLTRAMDYIIPHAGCLPCERMMYFCLMPTRLDYFTDLVNKTLKVT